MLQFRTLYDSPMIAVRDYICRHDHREASAEEQSDTNIITLMRHGAFARHFGKAKVTSDVNQASFFTKGSIYRVSHPTGCGDRGTSMVVADSILTDIIRELEEYGINVQITDPQADPEEAVHEYGVTLTPFNKLRKASAVVLAVAHNEYAGLRPEDLLALMGSNPVLADVKSLFSQEALAKAGIAAWRL